MATAPKPVKLAAASPKLVNLLDPEVLKRAAAIQRELQLRDQELLKLLRDSERLSSEDLAIRINTRG